MPGNSGRECLRSGPSDPCIRWTPNTASMSGRCLARGRVDDTVYVDNVVYFKRNIISTAWWAGCPCPTPQSSRPASNLDVCCRRLPAYRPYTARCHGVQHQDLLHCTPTVTLTLYSLYINSRSFSSSVLWHDNSSRAALNTSPSVVLRFGRSLLYFPSMASQIWESRCVSSVG